MSGKSQSQEQESGLGVWFWFLLLIAIFILYWIAMERPYCQTLDQAMAERQHVVSASHHVGADRRHEAQDAQRRARSNGR